MAIDGSEAGFQTDDDCGTWTRISAVVVADRASQQSDDDVRSCLPSRGATGFTGNGSGGGPDSWRRRRGSWEFP